MRNLAFQLLRTTHAAVIRTFAGRALARTPLRGAYYSVLDPLFGKLHPTVADVGGCRMELDRTDMLRLSLYGQYEPVETELCKRVVRSGQTVVDIGANIGYYTLLFSRLVGASGRVIAFEPDPTNFAMLSRNVKANGCSNVVPVNRAVGERAGKLRLFLSDVNMGDHRTYDPGDGRRSVEVEAVSLDDYFADDEGRVDFIKMDIQGGEGGALRGMCKLLERHRQASIVTEFWPNALAACGVPAEECFHILESLDLQVFHVDELRRRVEPTDRERILTACTRENDVWTNLYACPPASAAAVPFTLRQSSSSR